jgi:protein arginine kinase activator
LFADGSDWELIPSASRLCEACQEEPASINVIRLQEEEVVHTHLCADCAERSVEESDTSAVIFAVPAALRGVVGQLLDRAMDESFDASLISRACPVCGTTLSDLRETGLLGCAGCYREYSAEVGAALKALGAPDDHAGKVPRRSPRSVRRRQEVLRLETMLGELIAHERFEEAAGVRDRLAELALELGRSGD